MRECWINVSNIWVGGGRQEAVLGTKWATRSKAVATEYLSDYRLHVRLKAIAHDDVLRQIGPAFDAAQDAIV